ncbi:hypothetical protein PUMCH_003503 [Australozyma saopauloensis]|uniref:RRM domain-containing protein n=1 Tax=Australozyma saopauloensis TaxID=291208 RepID=A0AAX4HCE6_9ASCO|nr:hypothetical protein PUMCH_003503 [[Candida] saopauloensis]
MFSSTEDRKVFVKTLSRMILETKQSFPVKIIVDTQPAQETQIFALKNFLSKNVCFWEVGPSEIEIRVNQRDKTETLLRYLSEHEWEFLADYTDVDENPAVILATNISRSASLEKLTIALNSFCPYLSLLEADFTDESSHSVHLRFNNFLDVEALRDKRDIIGFCDDPKEALVFEKCESESLPKFLPLSQSTAPGLDAIALENAEEVFPALLTLEEIKTIVSKFELFGTVDSLCFPIKRHNESDFGVEKTAFVGFSHTSPGKAKVLECLYYLGDLTFKELLEFSPDSIKDPSEMFAVKDKDETDASQPRIKLSIVQKKHGHQLSKSIAFNFITLGEADSTDLVIRDEKDSEITSNIYNRFLKSNNYQETNVYVNNLPVLFQNDDDLWNQFWNQFGCDGINSAKIIKPQFYTKKHTETVGKIGFVFYKEFKMALRAIIMTNDREIYYPGSPPILIQTSFAIQKKNNSWSSSKYIQNKSGLTKELAGDAFINNLVRPMMKRASLPAIHSNEYSSYALMGPEPIQAYMYPPYDPFIFNPYYLHIPGYGMEGMQGQPPTGSPLSSPRSHMGASPMPPGMNGAFPPPYAYMMQFYPYSPPMPMEGSPLYFGTQEEHETDSEAVLQPNKKISSAEKRRNGSA